MSQITVLLPNARRQTLKVTPNTTILEVIEQVCGKAGLESDQFDLKHHRNILDSTSTIRFSSIPQNAQLELVEAKTKRKQTQIILCVQLENSERFQGECFPTDTLWEVLLKIAPEQIEAYSNPVIIYMRREIIGKESLHTTNLRSIGLSGGRAIVRLIDRSLEELRTQANVSSLLQRQANKDKHETKLDSDVATIQNGIEPQILKAEEKVERTENEAPSPVIESSTKFEVAENDKRNLRDVEDVNLNIAVPETYRSLSNIDDSDEKGNCKRARTKSPENFEVEKVLLLGDRSAVAYNLDTIQAPYIEELPDDFYELTLADAKSLVAAARRAITELEDGPLLTSAQRKLDEDGLILQKLSNHKSCIIRVKFPDRTVLQGIFKPFETLEEVYTFVASYLEQPTLTFCLYTTPPKNVLKPETRLVEADCVPGANLYFGPLAKEIPKNFLKSEVLQKFSSFSAVTNAAHSIRNIGSSDNVNLQSMQPQPNITDSKPGPSRLSAAGSSKHGTKNTNKDVPKWFKINK